MIDSHCHLAGEEFVADLPDVVARAKAAGVSAALCIVAAGDAAERERAGRLRKLWPEVRLATGIHPHQAGPFAGSAAAALDLVAREIDATGACAVGEIGLDYHYDFAPRHVQQDIFAAQVRLARTRGLPVVVHTREATEDTFRILREAGGGAVRGVLHCFTGDRAMAIEALALGFYVSFAGIVTFPRAGELREAAAAVDADRLLVETDSPYLAPVPHRGKRNEPAFVARVVETLAGLRATSAEEMARQVTANFGALFGPPRPEVPNNGLRTA
jgi:TatD DNase family protein